MTARILTSAEHALLAEEREWLGRLQLALARLDVAADDQRALEQSI